MKGHHGQKLHGKKKTKQKKWDDNKQRLKKKKVILSMLKLKYNNIVFIGDLEHSNPLLNSKTKTWEL